MHRCLQVAEIVNLVCLELSDGMVRIPGRSGDDVSIPKHGDLAVLARTSPVFSSHAFRCIWNSVTFINIMRCLPSDSFKLALHGIRYGRYIDWDMQLLRDLNDSDFDRIRFYAPLIQHLFSDFICTRGATILPTVSPWLPGMFPNLQGIHWTHVEEYSPLIENFIGPQLTTIHIPGTCRPSLTLLSSLPLLCTRLTDVSYLTRITSRPQELQPLAVSAASECVAKQLPVVAFAADCPRLSFSDDVHRLFSAAPTGISHLKLKKFSFSPDLYPFDRDRQPDYLLQCTSLERLFCFANVTNVRVLSAVGIDWDDATVTEMARSWPHLERLNLSSFYGTRAPRTTLRCLEAFAQFCPRLTSLHIAFDATTIPTSTSQFSLEKLETLGVDASPIARTPPVAQFLARIAPNLKDLTTLVDSVAADGDPDWRKDAAPHAFAYGLRWRIVEAILKSSFDTGIVPQFIFILIALYQLNALDAPQ
ncbi:hypothetical protein FB45DRAFT_1117018 [Roridomyces roridus]|uniref:F-box domain-containing protein n=1 Tax=Roridomyces roridus TaxID=1738132 RepID=A0AAD7B724_9AGAR|nr:hypothetical protein FB45DRAFT_1117018 [Roridomyces roridus]